MFAGTGRGTIALGMALLVVFVAFTLSACTSQGTEGGGADRAAAALKPMRTFEDADRPMLHPDVELHEIGGGEWVARAPDSEEEMGLSPQGIDILRRLDGEHSVAEIARDIAGDFQTDEVTAATQLRRFLSEMDREGMLAEP